MMDKQQVRVLITNRLKAAGGSARIPKRGGTFKATLVEGGVEVDNLGTQPFLPWEAFDEVVCLLIRLGGTAPLGNAMVAKQGGTELPVDSIEGHVAQVVYGKKPGDSVFRRITPLARILEWAGICKRIPRNLVLL